MGKRIKCTECDGVYERKKVPFDYLGQRVGIYQALVCNKCEDTMFESAVCAKMEKELKKRGLWGLRARATKAIIAQAQHS